MNRCKLHKKMILYCQNGETVRLLDYSETHIWVVYRGKTYTRPLTALQTTLFFEDPRPKDACETPAPPKQEPPKKSCMNCKFQISGECTSWDLCSDYQPAYIPSKAETDNWPKEGDATRFKRRGRR